MLMVALRTTMTAILVSRNRKILFMIQEIRSGRSDEFGFRCGYGVRLPYLNPFDT
jgi:hypothetical protein